MKKIHWKGAAIVILPVVVILAFAAGWLSHSLYQTQQQKKAELKGKTVKEFSVKKSRHPKVDLFVMSFCPYGNQIEDALLPVVKLLGNNVDWQPHYIINKMDLAKVCQRQVYTPARCQEYVKKGYFPNAKSCQQRLYPSLNACLSKMRPRVLLTDPTHGYFSLHGRQELNEDVREVCAWQEKKDAQQWWQFVAGVNKDCNLGNVETCWEKEAKKSGFDPAKIKDCFGSQALKILAAEEKLSREKKVSASPTLFINDQDFPPKGAYGKNVVLRVGKKIFASSQYRDPETLKLAVCQAFNKKPHECGKKLSSSAAPKLPSGNCGS